MFLKYDKKVHFRSVAPGHVAKVMEIIRDNADNILNNSHTQDRMREKGITAAMITDCLLSTDTHFIEYHTCESRDSRARVLLRYAIPNMSIATCVVIELETLLVRTCYINNGGDNHSTLDHKQYMGNAKKGQNLKLVEI